MKENNEAAVSIEEYPDIVENIRKMTTNDMMASQLKLSDIKNNIKHRDLYAKRLNTLILLDSMKVVLGVGVILALLFR